MIYKAFLGKEEANEFGLEGQSLDELRGGAEIFWKKTRYKPGIRVPSRYFETKLLCGDGSAVGYFTNYSQTQGSGYQKSLESVSTEKPFINVLHTWGTHEKIDKQGTESNYTRHVLSNQCDGKIYVMDFTWYSPTDPSTEQIAYFHNFFVIEDGKIKKSFAGTKMYFPAFTALIIGPATAKPAFFFSKDGDFHFYVVWTETVTTSGGEKEVWSDKASHLVFRNGQMVSQKEFVTDKYAFPLTIDNSPELKATVTLTQGANTYLAILTGDKLQSNGIYQIENINTGSLNMDITDGDYGVGKFEGRMFTSDTYAYKLYEYLGNGQSTLKYPTTKGITGTFRPWRFALYNNIVYVATNDDVYNAGDVDVGSGAINKIYKPEFKSGSAPAIRGIMVEKDALFVFYAKGKKYYMDMVLLKDLQKGDTK